MRPPASCVVCGKAAQAKLLVDDLGRRLAACPEHCPVITNVSTIAANRRTLRAAEEKPKRKRLPVVKCKKCPAEGNPEHGRRLRAPMQLLRRLYGGVRGRRVKKST